MITSTNLNALRNLEHFQVMSNVLSYLKEENLEELKLSAFAESFEKQLKVYDEVLVLERGNVLSLKLTDADKKRDDAYRALAGIVKTYTVFPEEEKADAALKSFDTIIAGRSVSMRSFFWYQRTECKSQLFQKF